MEHVRATGPRTVVRRARRLDSLGRLSDTAEPMASRTRPSRIASICLFALALPGCSDDGRETSGFGPPISTTTPNTTMGSTTTPDGGTTDDPTGATSDEPTTAGSTGDVGPACGDGELDALEECDDGPDNGDDKACTAACKTAVCGDGLVQAGVEGCDDGNAADGDGCSAACVPETCGDGVVDDGEACDDGNDVDDDACSNECIAAACGDGKVQMGEACDDGNAEDTDACLATCQAAKCGDGVVQAGVEACDDGNKSNASLAKHRETTAPSLPGPFRCLAGVLRSPPEPDRARLAVATTCEGAFWQRDGNRFCAFDAEALPSVANPPLRVRRARVTSRCLREDA